MKSFFIRLFFGLLTFGIILSISQVLNANWFRKATSFNFYIVPLIIVGGWGGWFLYKTIKNRK